MDSSSYNRYSKAAAYIFGAWYGCAVESCVCSLDVNLTPFDRFSEWLSDFYVNKNLLRFCFFSRSAGIPL